MKFFVSYARENNKDRKISDVIEKLKNKVESVFAPAEFWMDVEDSHAEDWRKRALSELESSDGMIVFLSDRYLEHENTLSEYAAFLKIEASLPQQNRIFVVSYPQMPELKAATVPLYVRRDMEHRNRIDGTGLRQHLQSAEFDAVVTKLSDTIGRVINTPARVQSKRSPPLPAPTLPKSLEPALEELKKAILLKPSEIEFQSEVIKQLLGNLKTEIETLSEGKYTHNISLNTNFMLRAKPVFQAALEVYAVSVDSYSSFWLAEDSRKTAEEYTKQQARKTYRLFVFSSAENLLAHRWVMAEHYATYGVEGRVIFTTRDAWMEFLRGFESGEMNEWLTQRYGTDFAILRYNLVKALDYDATLDRNQFELNKIEKMNDVHEAIMAAFHAAAAEDGAIPLGNRTAYEWRKEFEGIDLEGSDRDLPWFKVVYQLFPSYDVAERAGTSRVAHIVLFSKALQDNAEFVKEMQHSMPALREIKGRDGHRLAEAIWFGEITAIQGDRFPKDALHKQNLLIRNLLTENWPYCLIAYFKSQDELTQYYEHSSHQNVRWKIYKLFGPDIRSMCEHVDASMKRKDGQKAGDGDEPDNREADPVVQALAIALENTASRYMQRMDFEMPNEFASFGLVHAPRFGSFGEAPRRD
jgi:hypothetical protein